MPVLPESLTLIDRINALLPQTQCGQCSFHGCRPYAEAIASGAADINQCPPGGDEGIRDLADLLGIPFKPLNTKFGLHKPAGVAFIIEEDCIGCVKCIAACPVDAILGAAKFMHTVIASECTGCELCVAPCPVDCIIMTNPPGADLHLPEGRQAGLPDVRPVPVNNNEQSRAQKAAKAKRRYDARCLRKEKEEAEKAERAKKKRQLLLKMQAAKK